ncbi:hypothetical protein [Embleya sp. NPDC001921]
MYARTAATHRPIDDFARLITPPSPHLTAFRRAYAAVNAGDRDGAVALYAGDIRYEETSLHGDLYEETSLYWDLHGRRDVNRRRGGAGGTAGRGRRSARQGRLRP